MDQLIHAICPSGQTEEEEEETVEVRQLNALSELWVV